MSILNRCSIVFLAVFFHVQCRAQLQATVIRQPGASLDLSIQNEVDHAVQLSAQWIVRQQQGDGAWGVGTRRHALTAMGVIALHATQLSSVTPALQRGVEWLEKNVPATDEKQLSTLAWYLLAVSLTMPESAERSDIVSRVFTNGTTRVEGASSVSVALWDEAVMAAKLGDEKEAIVPAASATNQLEKLAASWPVVATNPETVWRLARLINRAADGRLVYHGAVLDWRVDLARGLLGAFRKDPAGGGYWDAKTEEGRLQATFFGIFALREL